MVMYPLIARTTDGCVTNALQLILVVFDHSIIHNVLTYQLELIKEGSNLESRRGGVDPCLS